VNQTDAQERELYASFDRFLYLWAGTNPETDVVPVETYAIALGAAAQDYRDSVESYLTLGGPNLDRVNQAAIALDDMLFWERRRRVRKHSRSSFTKSLALSPRPRP
jgi:hypothetical protein